MKLRLGIINLLVPILSLLILVRCTEIFETNLEFKNVTLLGPDDGLHTNLRTFTFWWDDVDGARMYNLQIVTPSFKKVENLVIDTIISSNKFKYTLSPGPYEWRVCALNASSSTRFESNSLFVDLGSASINLTQEIEIWQPYFNRSNFLALSTDVIKRELMLDTILNQIFFTK